MIHNTSKIGIKNGFEILARLPFCKKLIHKASEAISGNSVVFFSIHRVLKDNIKSLTHPHLLNKTAITKTQAQKFLTQIHRSMPFISLLEAEEFLLDKKKLNRSSACLIIEAPYLQTIELITPFLIEHKIPVTIALSQGIIKKQETPWADQIINLLYNTEKKSICVDFMDRSFNLSSPRERLFAANYFVDNLNNTNKELFINRLALLKKKLKPDNLSESETIAPLSLLKTLSLNPLFSFACTETSYPLPEKLSKKNLEDIIKTKQIINQTFECSVQPAFLYPNNRFKLPISLIDSLRDNYKLFLINQKGICRTGDNMFKLKRLPLAQGIKNFERFELQDLSTAIDEFLLVTLANEKTL